MSTENNRQITVRILGRALDVNVDLLTAVSGLLSTLIAVLALIFGIFQFYKGLKITQDQIQFVKDEKNERNEENRPIIRTALFDVTCDEVNWHYKLRLANAGKREADSLVFENTILSYDGSENLSDSYIVPVYHRVVSAHGLLTQDTLRDNKTFKRIDEDIYLARFVVTYRDKVSRISYPFVKYYKINLNFQPAKITEYYDDQKHSNANYHEAFHKVFDLYF